MFQKKACYCHPNNCHYPKAVEEASLLSELVKAEQQHPERHSLHSTLTPPSYPSSTQALLHGDCRLYILQFLAPSISGYPQRTTELSLGSLNPILALKSKWHQSQITRAEIGFEYSYKFSYKPWRRCPLAVAYS